MRRPLLRRSYLRMLRTEASMRTTVSADRNLLRSDGVAHRAAAAYEGFDPRAHGRLKGGVAYTSL